MVAERRDKDMEQKTKKIKQFFTRTYNKDNTVPFAWFNTEYYLLEEEDMLQLHNYMKDKRLY